MTLIAGFPAYGTPVLIGDFLTSTDAGPSGHSKKVLLISDNFALAWTGHWIAANSVIRSLQSSLDVSHVTLDSVTAVLTDPETSDLGSGINVQLVGWVADARGNHCFFWDSGKPMELSLEAPRYAGSGAKTALHIAGTHGLYHRSPPDEHDPHQVSRGALGVTSRLMSYEMWGPSTKQWGFGHAYEILRLVDGRRFEYLDDTLYLPIGIELDEHGRYLRSKFGTAFFKYQAHGNCSIIHVHNPTTSNQEVDIITPPGREPAQAEEVTRDLSQRISNEGYSYPFESAFYCHIYQLKSPNFVSPQFFSVIPKEEVGFPGYGVKVDIGKEAISVEIKREWAEWSYKTIFEAESNSKS
ncbi:MAG: hypothetical protein HOP35_10895 [Nitrospira sp.]|nr:hypothetical protein [Nitrospira sp.]